MIESKSVQKRSVGRPKTNKALQKLRVQTWFNAVAEASGKTAYELEKEFAPSTVDRENFNKQRARLWEKYRLGKTMPTIKEKKGGRKGIAQLVEEKYPGTLKILDDPIWKLMDPEEIITMEYLRSTYESLPMAARHLFIKDNIKPDSTFWKKENTSLIELDKVWEIDKFLGIKVYFCHLRELIISQKEIEFKETQKLITIKISKERAFIGNQFVKLFNSFSASF